MKCVHDVCILHVCAWGDWVTHKCSTSDIPVKNRSFEYNNNDVHLHALIEGISLFTIPQKKFGLLHELSLPLTTQMKSYLPT